MHTFNIMKTVINIGVDILHSRHMIHAFLMYAGLAQFRPNLKCQKMNFKIFYVLLQFLCSQTWNSSTLTHTYIQTLRPKWWYTPTSCHSHSHTYHQDCKNMTGMAIWVYINICLNILDCFPYPFNSLAFLYTCILWGRTILLKLKLITIKISGKQIIIINYTFIYHMSQHWYIIKST